MVDVFFYDKFGTSKKYNSERSYVRERNYAIIRNKGSIACRYDHISGLYSFPNEDDIALNEEPTAQFSIISYIWDNGTPIKELQCFSVYTVKKTALDSALLVWCSEKDILVGKINMDKTQIGGLKNLLVRVKQNA